MNILPALAFEDSELLELLIARSDDPAAPWQSNKAHEPCIQVMSDDAWRRATAQLRPPDGALAIAELNGQASAWREALPIRQMGLRLLVPNDMSHMPRIMMFSFNEITGQRAINELAIRVVADIVAVDLRNDENRAEVAFQLRADLAARRPSEGVFLRRLKRFRRQTCRLMRTPGGCVSEGCDGVCEGYLVADYPREREVCTCTRL